MMKRTSICLATATLAISAGMSLGAFAQPAAHLHDHGHAGAMGEHGKHMAGHTAGHMAAPERLAAFKAAINPTAAQLPLWNAYEAAATKVAAERAQIVSNAKAQGLTHEQVRAQMKALHQQSFAEVGGAMKALRASLSPEQLAAAKALRGQHGGNRPPKG